MDFLVVNLLVQILTLFHWKFWFLYLIFPVYAFSLQAYEYYKHVKTVGKADGSEDAQANPRAGKGKTNSSSQKKMN